MALTTSLVSRNVVGNQRMNVITATFDASYLTGGEVFQPVDAQMKSFDMVIPTAGAYNDSAYSVQYASPYLLAFDTVTGKQAPSTTDLVGLSVNLLCIGR
jgi:hypothetical protein